MNITVDINLSIDIDTLMDETLRDIITEEIRQNYMEDIVDSIEVSE